MDVACSTHCFSNEPLEQCLRHIAELDFQKVDMAIGDDNPQLKPSEIVADSGLIMRRMKQGPTIGIAALTVQSKATGGELVAVVEAIAHFAKQIAAPVIAIDADSTSGSFEEEVARLTKLTVPVQLHGCVLTVTTKVGTWTERPDAAIKLCEQVPGLGITLDPSHYVFGPHQNGSYDEIFPHVRHAHLRDSGKRLDQPQVRVGRGEVEYGKIISSLKSFRFKGSIAVDFDRNTPCDFEIEPEVRKMRLLLESLL